MVIEFARNVLGITDAEHAEYDPYASKLVINPLSCSLAGQTLEIEIVDSSSKTFQCYGANTIKEKYYCNFGLNPEYEQLIDKNGFGIVGRDKLQEARILELSDHDFFIATLFVPQDNSTKESPHPLTTRFLQVVSMQNIICLWKQVFSCESGRDWKLTLRCSSTMESIRTSGE